MGMKVDVGVASLSKHGEEVCGDSYQVIRSRDATTVILSDGLGSGIKASILSLLSTKIASRLLERNINVEQVFATIADTLPICQTREIAYSTLSILKITDSGYAHLIEYDNPSLILIRNGQRVKLDKEQKIIAGKKVSEVHFKLKLGDLLLVVSDGVINAGVGGLFHLGLGRERLVEHVTKYGLYKKDSLHVARDIIELTEACYICKPGDDSTCIALKLREPRSVVVLTGPPTDPDLDGKVVKEFLKRNNSEKVVCGGATGNMVARELGEDIETSLTYDDPSVPPLASIKGIDLVTEGILTLNKCLEKILQLKKGQSIDEKKDGASLLARTLFKADQIHFLVGTAVNPAHQELMQSLQLKPRPVIVNKLIKELAELGKEIKIKRY
ncbi:SpoIIE family protein phosphatase [Halothermothrix orenii]|uniref:Stage II sporulation E family protein n=1 Tax=Halothermothrix orenii (strain H 168 / OCM 544 / DSM 9562) TaxID=373903 RepID=B8D0Z9_HALOH|nr:SpoIIE family protein phosphatase [Halothermothrix orenii]ACL68968.1 Stage II sporulation E family protein [Halothermothrix orenii H 168]